PHSPRAAWGWITPTRSLRLRRSDRNRGEATRENEPGGRVPAGLSRWTRVRRGGGGALREHHARLIEVDDLGPDTVHDEQRAVVHPRHGACVVAVEVRLPGGVE